MSEAHEIWKASKPHKGDAVTYEGKPHGHVTSVEGNLCWCTGDTSGPFIWCFKDALNTLHDWPAKSAG